jgi:predicted Zn-dependent protease
MDRMLKTAAVDPDIAEMPIILRLRNKYWNSAVSYFRRGQFESAAECITSLLQSCPEDAQAHAFLGSILLRRYQIDEAVKHLDKAIKIAPESPFVRMKMAEYWMALGIPGRALEELKQAELYAADDLTLYDKIHTLSKELQRKARGNIERTIPALPISGVQKMLAHFHLKRTTQSDTGGSPTPC